MAIETSLKVSMKWDGANKLCNTSYHQFQELSRLFDQQFPFLGKRFKFLPFFFKKIDNFFSFCRFFLHFSYLKPYIVFICVSTHSICDNKQLKWKRYPITMKYSTKFLDLRCPFHQKNGPGWYRKKIFLRKWHDRA